MISIKNKKNEIVHDLFKKNEINYIKSIMITYFFL